MLVKERLHSAAQALLQARQSGVRLAALPEEIRPQSQEEAYAIQDIQLRAFNPHAPVAAWKVGAKSATAEPTCAALSHATVFASSDDLAVPHLQIRGVEVELGVVLAGDLPPRDTPYNEAEVLHAIGTVCVAIEVVDSRFEDSALQDSFSRMADFSGHGLVVFDKLGVAGNAFDAWDNHSAELRIGNGKHVSGASQNPAVDVKRLLIWLANHASRRGCGLQKGQLVITGSCFPMLMAEHGQQVTAQLTHVGEISIALPTKTTNT